MISEVKVMVIFDGKEYEPTCLTCEYSPYLDAVDKDGNLIPRYFCPCSLTDGCKLRESGNTLDKIKKMASYMDF